MAQKPITMEQLKQILQLKNDGIGIREIARRTDMSRNRVRKYLSQLDAGTNDLTNKQLDKIQHYTKNQSLFYNQRNFVSVRFEPPQVR
jgi:response regulator of citrate/malate metabolism